MTPTREPEALNFVMPVSVTDDEFETETIYSRVSSTITYPTDASTEDQMNVVEASGALDFWNHPEEDIYKEADGDAM